MVHGEGFEPPTNCVYPCMRWREYIPENPDRQGENEKNASFSAYLMSTRRSAR